jgi:hypothetical protein
MISTDKQNATGRPAHFSLIYNCVIAPRRSALRLANAIASLTLPMNGSTEAGLRMKLRVSSNRTTLKRHVTVMAEDCRGVQSGRASDCF